MENGIVFDLDPTLIRIGSMQIRYYGVIFATTFWAGFFLFRYYMMRKNFTSDQTLWFLPWFIGGLIVGARLAHCLFYEPDKYLADPFSMIYFWKGGLSSHGATVGILTGMYGYSRQMRNNYLDLVDRFSPSAAIGAAAVRLGNFTNSEIVGHETDVPWAVRFVRYDHGIVARHPSQIYEFILGVLVLISLLIADKMAGKEERPIGLITGLFALIYFGGRFFVEFTKEYQGIDEGWALTMGQWLCFPFIGLGIGFIVYAKLLGTKKQI